MVELLCIEPGWGYKDCGKPQEPYCRVRRVDLPGKDSSDRQTGCVRLSQIRQSKATTDDILDMKVRGGVSAMTGRTG